MLKDPLVTPHSLYLALAQDATIRAQAYRAWLLAGVSDDDLQRIRIHLQQEQALGDAKFQIMFQGALGRPVSVRPRGLPASP
jgi:putative transposase